MIQDFSEFLKHREAAAVAYVSGDAAPVLALSTSVDPASFFGPDGGSVTGADTVRRSHRTGAGQFEPAGTSHFEIVQSASEGRIGFWTGFQHAKVKIKGKDIEMSLRVTEVFRNEGGEWKLVHRHADMGRAGQQ